MNNIILHLVGTRVVTTSLSRLQEIISNFLLKAMEISSLSYKTVLAIHALVYMMFSPDLPIRVQHKDIIQLHLVRFQKVSYK